MRPQEKKRRGTNILSDNKINIPDQRNIVRKGGAASSAKRKRWLQKKGEQTPPPDCQDVSILSCFL